MNGNWFSWNGYWTENAKGAETFKEAYRHIFCLFQEEGAINLIRVYHVNWYSKPEESWNTFSAYYPGDEFVDIIGISIYGALTPDQVNVFTFSDMMDRVYPEIAALNPDTPIIVAETGTDIHNANMNPVTWTREAILNLTSLKAASNWDCLVE